MSSDIDSVSSNTFRIIFSFFIYVKNKILKLRIILKINSGCEGIRAAIRERAITGVSHTIDYASLKGARQEMH